MDSRTINFEQFIYSEQQTSAAIRWKKYTLRFKNMLKAYKIEDDDQKKALLLHHAGEEVFDIFSTLADHDTKNFDESIELLNNYFCPKKSLEFEIHKFRSARQTDDETIDAFHTRLRKLVSNCDFHDANNEIKHQIIQTCHSKKLRMKALQDSPTLDQLLKMGRSMEMVTFQMNEMENKQNVYTAKRQVNKNKYEKNENKKKCFRCGGSFPHTSECPAIGKTCNHCGKQNHFSTCCKSQRQEVKYNEDISAHDSNDGDEEQISDEDSSF